MCKTKMAVAIESDNVWLMICDCSQRSTKEAQDSELDAVGCV